MSNLTRIIWVKEDGGVDTISLLDLAFTSRFGPKELPKFSAKSFDLLIAEKEKDTLLYSFTHDQKTNVFWSLKPTAAPAYEKEGVWKNIVLSPVTPKFADGEWKLEDSDGGWVADLKLTPEKPIAGVSHLLLTFSSKAATATTAPATITDGKADGSFSLADLPKKMAGKTVTQNIPGRLPEIFFLTKVTEMGEPGKFSAVFSGTTSYPVTITVTEEDGELSWHYDWGNNVTYTGTSSVPKAGDKKLKVALSNGWSHTYKLSKD